MSWFCGDNSGKPLERVIAGKLIEVMVCRSSNVPEITCNSRYRNDRDLSTGFANVL
jgi:hypothetical protein